MKMIGRTIILLSMTMEFLTACSTPTVSSDDSDENSEKVERTGDSSSSGIRSDKEANSSSSSGKKTESSSSEKTSESSSSSASEVNCAALLEGESEWRWGVSKECRLNPNIEYGSMTDGRDGQVYKTVKIGKQTWMAENLNYDPDQGGAGEAKYDWSWCYNNDPKKCAVTGRLYTWAAAIDSVKLYRDESIDCGDGKTCSLPETVHGICPNGWHLPTDVEWSTLIYEAGNVGDDYNSAAKNLKSRTGWYNGENGTDACGFAAFPAGYRNFDGYYNYDGDDTYFLSATELGSDHIFGIGLGYSTSIVYLTYRKNIGFSIRCLKD